jgi:hypothetical protein
MRETGKSHGKDNRIYKGERMAGKELEIRTAGKVAVNRYKSLIKIGG